MTVSKRSEGRTAITLSDVARAAQVSVGTVSSVINGARSNSKVSPETRRRIESAATALGYRPNAVARSLAQRRTNVIGFYSGYGIVDARSPFMGEILTGFKDGCVEFRQDLLIHGTFRGDSVEDIYRELANGKIDGLILYSPPDDPLISYLSGSHLPVVAIADPIPSLPSVIVDDAHGSRLIADHLAAQGHRRVLYRKGKRSALSVDHRFLAFQSAAGDHRMRLWEGHMTSDEAWERQPASRLNPQLASLRLSAEEKAILSNTDEPPTAAVCWCDGSAYALLAEYLEMGRRVPEDLAIVGFDGLTTFVQPLMTLTTVRAPWAQVAQAGVRLLMDQINGQEVPPTTVLPVELVLGETT